jgi:hypothetical protein
LESTLNFLKILVLRFHLNRILNFSSFLDSKQTLPRPAFSVEAAVLEGFGQVLYSDVLALGNIRNGAGYFEDAVVGSEKL